MRTTSSFRSCWNLFRSTGEARGNRASWRRGPYVWASIAAGVIGLALSVAGWLVVSARENRLAEHELSGRANSHALILQNGINEYIAKVAALRALFESNSEVNRREFMTFSKFLLRGQTAILAVSWIPRITHANRIAHELAAAHDGFPSYSIKTEAADRSLSPKADATEYFPLFYSSRESQDSDLYGLDLNDGGIRQQTLERARDRDQAASSPTLVLHRGDGDRNGFFIVLPTYRPGLPRDTVEDRRNNLVGYLQGVFQTGMLIETILRTTTIPGGLDLYFFAADSSVDVPPPLYFHPSRLRTVAINAQPRAALTAGPHWSTELRAGDGRWTFIAAPIPGGPGTSSHYGAWLVLSCGLLVTWVVVAYIWMSGSRSLAALNLANKQLQTQNARCDAALNNMSQGLVMFDTAEQILLCNDRYIEMYGLSREIVKPGCSLRELLRHRAETGHLNRNLEQYRSEMLAELALGKIAYSIVETADGRKILITNKSMAGGLGRHARRHHRAAEGRSPNLLYGNTRRTHEPSQPAVLTRANRKAVCKPIARAEIRAPLSQP